MATKRPNLSFIDDTAENASEAAPAAPTAPSRKREAGITRTTLYLPDAVHETIRQVAFTHRLKPHDVIMQGIDLVLRTQYGMPGVEKRKTPR